MEIDKTVTFKLTREEICGLIADHLNERFEGQTILPAHVSFVTSNKTVTGARVHYDSAADK